MAENPSEQRPLAPSSEEVRSLHQMCREGRTLDR